MVEQEAVNFEVVGSSPTPGAKPSNNRGRPVSYDRSFYFCQGTPYLLDGSSPVSLKVCYVMRALEPRKRALVVDYPW